jgi:hypothetical protein
MDSLRNHDDGFYRRHKVEADQLEQELGRVIVQRKTHTEKTITSELFNGTTYKIILKIMYNKTKQKVLGACQIFSEICSLFSFLFSNVKSCPNYIILTIMF